MTAKTETRTRRLPFERIPVRRIILVALSLAIIYGVVAGSAATLQTGTFSGADWRTLVVNGLARGSVYALIAIGYTLVYGVLFMINFAHGEVFMSGTYTSFFVATALAESGYLNEHPLISIGILFVVSMVVSTVVAIILERLAYRPLRGAPRLVPLITAIGASLFLQYTFRGLYGANVRAYPEIAAIQGTWEIFGFDFLKKQVIVIVAAMIFWLILYLVVAKTKTGRAMRAVGEDREVAALMGIDVDRTIVATFAIGGALAGAAGILFVFVFNQVIFIMGFLPGLKAFTAAVLGGIGSISGAALGGLVLGVLEAIGPNLFLTGANVPSPNQLQPVVAFGILVLVLIFLPGGFLGSDEEERA